MTHQLGHKKIFNEGVSDILGYNGNNKSYMVWYDMLRRCYSDKYQNKEPAYRGCIVCDEWKYFSNFKEWFDENYIEGYQLDKDILVKGNKVYSPLFCRFIPKQINLLFGSNKRRRGEYPIGVYRCNKDYRIVARIMKNNKYINLGGYKTVEEAFNAYKREKEKHLKNIAQEYFDNGLIGEDIYESLINHTIEITD